MKYPIIILFLFLFNWLRGQGYTSVDFLKVVEETNLQLIAEQAGLEAQKTSYKQNMGLEDSEIEAVFFSGSPSEMGNRQVISISQAFDLPILYASRKKLAEANARQDVYRYQQKRQEILFMAESCFVEYVFQQKTAQLAEKRKQVAENLMKSYEAEYTMGNASVLDYNKAKIQYAIQQNNYMNAQNTLMLLQKKLNYLAGGKFENIECSYRPLSLPAKDSLETAVMKESPDLQYWQSQQKLSDLDLQLSRRQNLPKLMLAYEGEFEEQGAFHGIKAGISMPLWSNKYKVKYAKLQQYSAMAKLASVLAEKQTEAELLYADVESLIEKTQLCRQTAEETASTALLNKALEMGQISVIEYFNELHQYYEIENLYLETERDLYLKYAELMKYGN